MAFVSLVQTEDIFEDRRKVEGRHLIYLGLNMCWEGIHSNSGRVVPTTVASNTIPKVYHHSRVWMW
jgi:hypothetical protein